MSDLETKLNTDPDVTELDVIAYLRERINSADSNIMHTMPIDQFWQPGDLDRYKQAKAWWPTDATDQLNALWPLGMLCNGIASTTNIPLATFQERLYQCGERCVQWLKREGRNVENPNESKEERKRRLGREAQKRHRQTKAAAVIDPQAAEVRRLYKVFMDACEARKKVVAEQDLIVGAAMQAWKDAKAAMS